MTLLERIADECKLDPVQVQAVFDVANNVSFKHEINLQQLYDDFLESEEQEEA